MTPIVRGKYVLKAISKLKEPAHLDDIVDYLAPNFNEPKTKLTKIVKTTLDAGVRYGFLERFKEKYYSEKSQANDNYASDDEVDSITSGGSMDSLANDQELDGIRSFDSMDTPALNQAKPTQKIVKAKTAAKSRGVMKTVKKNQKAKSPASKKKQAAVFSYSDDDDYPEDRLSRRGRRSRRSRSGRRARSYGRSRSRRRR